MRNVKYTKLWRPHRAAGGRTPRLDFVFNILGYFLFILRCHRTLKDKTFGVLVSINATMYKYQVKIQIPQAGTNVLKEARN